MQRRFRARLGDCVLSVRQLIFGGALRIDRIVRIRDVAYRYYSDPVDPVSQPSWVTVDPGHVALIRLSEQQDHPVQLAGESLGMSFE